MDVQILGTGSGSSGANDIELRNKARDPELISDLRKWRRVFDELSRIRNQNSGHGQAVAENNRHNDAALNKIAGWDAERRERKALSLSTKKLYRLIEGQRKLLSGAVDAPLDLAAELLKRLPQPTLIDRLVWARLDGKVDERNVRHRVCWIDDGGGEVLLVSGVKVRLGQRGRLLFHRR